MSRAQANRAAVLPTLKLRLRGWRERVSQRLYVYRPRFRDWHFWTVQSIVIAIAVAHSVVEAPGILRDLGVPSFVPTTLFLVPVVYAALTFGFAGAVATALWATVLSIHNWVLWHEGLELFACMFQMLIVNGVAFFVGRRVDREWGVWQKVEVTATALKASRMKYRGLFESSPFAILVLDLKGVVLEANPAASILFGRTSSALEGVSLAELIGGGSEQKLLNSYRNGKWQAEPLVLKLKGGLELYLEPTLTEVGDGQGNIVIQVLFRDVTKERGRQVGLKAYTAHVIRAQEGERQRIARTLHDEILQSVVLLCRRLDGVQGVSESLPASVASRLQEARRTAEETARQLRDFARVLRPPILDDLGIVTSIRRLLADFMERTRIKGQLEVSGEGRRLSPDMELGLFRIAQEALWNVEHHAQATRVAVLLNFAEHKVRLEVVDNGIGFTVPSASGDFTSSGQLGLISMQERTELLNGELMIQSSPGKGTRVAVSVPVTEDISEVPGKRLGG